jgi:outer membrane protein OmpA-like peptidoglycan-associated protein
MGMKCVVLRTALITVLSVVLFSPSFSQNYYLVVGAFSTESDDVREFTSFLPGQSQDTSYSITTNNSLLHFYVLKTSNKEMAMARSQKLQESLQELQGQLSSKTNSGSGPENNQPVAVIPEPEVYATAGSSKSTSENSPSSGGIPPKPKGKFFKFTITSDDGSALPGEVHHVDLERNRELGSFTTDSYIDFLRPGKNQTMTIVCGVFGYKEVEKQIDFSNPSLTEGVYQDEQGAWVIPYALERVESGDVTIMYNVSFYKDAVPMLPGSQKDLDALVSLMTLNPGYTIKVHAHCNGKNSRKIITMDDTNNFFDSQESVQIKGSAKQLTNLRASAIRTYLINHGIAKERIKTYGWGGSYMLVDELGPHAKMNDRIEIEILKD